MKYAIIVIDMLNDFIGGALTCERAEAIVPHVQKLLASARANGVPVIFSNDAHYPEIDREFAVWGTHAVEGTKGAEVIPELNANPEIDYIVPKRRYSGFFGTDLDSLLRELKVDTVIMAGLHAHICVRHTSADAFQLGYNIVVPTDCTDSFTKEDYDIGIKYLHDVYGARLTTSNDLIKEFEK